LCQASQIAIVINKYKIVQTGAKTQSGGLKPDFVSEEYHGSLCDIVAKPPTNDAEKVTKPKIKKDINLFFNI
tara:strand:+ start:3617 stop:3832 length:216 start_codon:yes stop_codon:yes gene_type:complete